MYYFFILFLAARMLGAQTYDFLENRFADIEGQPSIEGRIIELVNSERAKANLPPVSHDVKLQSAARQHSVEMRDLKYFSHFSPRTAIRNPEDRVYRTGCSDAVVGENIAVHSFDADDKEVADKLMEQWMNSPAHRANILKPEFTHLGVGVASLKDSVRRDTVIGGSKGHVIVYTIRHYGTQIFSVRKMEFDELKLVKRTADFVSVRLRFQFDRDILGSVGNYTRFFKPDARETTVWFEYPADSTIRLNLAAVQNENVPEYAVFFQSVITPVNFLSTFDGLSKSPITVLDKEIKTAARTKFFLECRGRLLDKQPQQLVLSLDSDRYYEFDIRGGSFSVTVPLDEDSKKIAFALGNGPAKDVVQRIRVFFKSTDLFGKDY